MAVGVWLSGTVFRPRFFFWADAAAAAAAAVGVTGCPGAGTLLAVAMLPLAALDDAGVEDVAVVVVDGVTAAETAAAVFVSDIFSFRPRFSF